MRVIRKIGLWGGGVILVLHLLACSQEGKVQSEKVTLAQALPSHAEAVHTGDARPQSEIEVSNPAINTPLRVESVSLDPPDHVYRGQDITAIARGVDPDGDEVSFQYLWVINGEALPTENSPVLRGDRFKRGDKVSVRVTPHDREGPGEVYKPLPIVIPNAPPRFTSTPPMEFKSSTYIYQATAEDADGDPIRFSLTSASFGMTIDPETGRTDWEISRADTGSHSIEVIAEDGFGGQAFQKYTLSIAIP